MKNLFIYLIILNICCTEKPKSNKNETGYQEIKNLKFVSDSINCGDIIVSGLRIGDSSKKIIEYLGKPDSIFTRIDDEYTPEFESEVYAYENSELYVYKNSLFGFDLRGNRFTFNNVNVGGDISFFESKYPTSFNNATHKKNNQLILNFYGRCNDDKKSVPSINKIILSYNDEKKITQIITSED